MKDAFAGDFEATLKKMQWPGKDVTLDGQLEQEWTNGVEKLLELQEPELNARDGQTMKTTLGEESLVLLPLEVMVKPLELRFKYHFEGDRPTNKLGKVSINDETCRGNTLTPTARVLSLTRHYSIKYLRRVFCNILTTFTARTFRKVKSSVDIYLY